VGSESVEVAWCVPVEPRFIAAHRLNFVKIIGN
jgi:hypothetical protein